MLQQLWAISQNTYKESIRQPIFVVLLLMVSGLLGLAPTFTAYTLDDDNKLLIDLGLSTIFLGGLFLAAFTTAGVLDREIRNRTVVTMLSKPVARPLFIIAKYIGVFAAMATAHWIWSAAFLLAVQHGVLMRASDVLDQPVLTFGLGAAAFALLLALWANYFRGKLFATWLTFSLAPLLTVAYFAALCFDREWHAHSPSLEFNGQLLIALLLVLEGLAILSAVAVAASTRLGQLMTLLTCTIFLGLGLTADYLYQSYASLSGLAHALILLVPNFQFLWLADAVTEENPVNLGYVAMVTLYTFFYVVAGLGVAVALFQTRDVG